MGKPAAGMARVTGVAVCMVLGVAVAPAASAAFTASSQAATNISTAVLPTPTSADFVFTYVCARNKKTLDVTIATAAVLPYADAITVTPAGMPTVTYAISALPQTFTMSSAQTGASSVTYAFEIRTAYRIPGSAGRLWTSQAPLQVQHTCA